MSRNTHYRRERFVLLIGCLVIALTAPFYTPAHSQSRTLGKVVIKVTLNDNEKTANLVQNFGLVIKKLSNDSPEIEISAIRVKTTADGSVSLSLIPGDYIVESEKPLIVKGKSYEWSVKLSKQMSLQIVSLQSPTTPEIKVVDRRLIQQVWSDFAPYRH